MMGLSGLEPIGSLGAAVTAVLLFLYCSEISLCQRLRTVLVIKVKIKNLV
jgi:hypothetical protein